MLADLTWVLLVQALAFVTLLLVDMRLRERELLTDSYLGVRIVATATACLSLLVIMLSA